uniref:HdeD family acid-resistance protein n=1 Tax=Halomonas sp. TaxID=1486246 RepID=UPI00261E8211|nr:HdeD family acid-resistance protein [Halomonas sp.]
MAMQPTPDMSRLTVLLARQWWVLLLRGLAAIVFGVLAWMYPAMTVEVLIIMFGAYCLVDGVLGVITALVGRKRNSQWIWLLLWGLASIVIGAITFASPGVTALVLLMFIAAWAIVTGLTQLVTAIRLRKEVRGEWLLGLSGLASLIFGVLLIVIPGAGAIALLWLIAFYAVLFGILLVILSLRIRKFGQLEA